jgi:hypothetical protein
MIGHTREVWAGNDGAALLDFDEQERVAYTHWASDSESFLDRLRGWLGI